MKISSGFAGVALLAALCLSSCSESPSYLSFTHRDQTYYQSIAEACDAVRQNTPLSAADGNKISPDSSSLPAVLRDLHPDYFRVTTNRVFMSIGVGRGSYGIAWQRAGASWELRTYAESLETVLFTRANL